MRDSTSCSLDWRHLRGLIAGVGEVAPKTLRVDPDTRAGHACQVIAADECLPDGLQGAKLCDRFPVAGDHEGLARRHRIHDLGVLVAKFSLRNGPGHGLSVAKRAVKRYALPVLPLQGGSGEDRLTVTGWHDMMEAMDGTRVKLAMRALGAVLGVAVALLMCGPTAGVAQAAVAAPAGDAIAIGDPHALGVVDLYVDPMCPFSGQMVQEQGDDIGRRIENGMLRVNLRFVNFLDKYSASKTYDIRATYATFVVADQSRSSDITWRFVQQIFSAEQQPQEGGSTDLDNNQLAELANRVGAPPPAQDLIRLGLPIGYDARAIAANNLALLRQSPEPGVPTVVINGQPVDGNSDWLDQLPG